MAVRVARELARLGVVWFEDPTEPTDDLAGLQPDSARPSICRLITGERLFGRAAFWPLLRRASSARSCPDVKHCGGLWEGKKIAAMAEAARVMVSPHNPSGPVATLASAHLAATLPNFSRLEYAWGEVPWRAALISARPSRSLTASWWSPRRRAWARRSTRPCSRNTASTPVPTRQPERSLRSGHTRPQVAPRRDGEEASGRGGATPTRDEEISVRVGASRCLARLLSRVRERIGVRASSRQRRYTRWRRLGVHRRDTPDVTGGRDGCGAAWTAGRGCTGAATTACVLAGPSLCQRRRGSDFPSARSISAPLRGVVGRDERDRLALMLLIRPVRLDAAGRDPRATPEA